MKKRIYAIDPNNGYSGEGVFTIPQFSDEVFIIEAEKQGLVWSSFETFLKAFNDGYVSDEWFVRSINTPSGVSLMGKQVKAFVKAHDNFVDALISDIRIMLGEVGAILPDGDLIDEIEFFSYTTAHELDIQGIDENGIAITGASEYSDGQSFVRYISDGYIPMYDAISVWSDLAKITGRTDYLWRECNE